MPQITVTPEEAGLLRLAALAVLFEGGVDADAAERALVVLAHSAASDPPPVSSPAARWALREMSGDEGHLPPLAAAVAERRRVSFRYRSGETPADQTRRVEPWGLGYRNGAWYLAGFDVDRRDSRVFRVGRVAGEVRTTRRRDAFRSPEDVDLRRFFEAPPWSFGPVHGPSVEARLLVQPARAETVLAMMPETMATRRLDDGRLLLRLFVRDAGSFFDWVLPLGLDAEIVSPGELRSQLAVRLETTAVAWGRK